MAREIICRDGQGYLRHRKALLLISVVSGVSLCLLYSFVHEEHPAIIRFENYTSTSVCTGACSNEMGERFRENSTAGPNITWYTEVTATASYSHEPPRIQCDVLLNKGNVGSWEKGVVTQFEPVIPCNCTKLINMDEEEISSVEKYLDKWHKKAKFMSQLKDWSQSGINCDEITAELHNSFYVSQEELDFPLAFSFVIYERSAQVVRLFKAIYRPHNIYCFHPDGKSDANFVSAFRFLANCLDNVIMPEELIEVYWGHHSIMDAQMACMTELSRSEVRSKYRWKYAINVCGTELPLRTNREIVRALKPLYKQGLSAVEKRYMNAEAKSRFFYKWYLNQTTGFMQRTSTRLGAPPHGISMVKSWNFIGAKDSFVDFLLHSHIAQEFRKWTTDTVVPEEHFYGSLYYLNHTYPESDLRSYPCMQVSQWLTTVKQEDKKKYCRGEQVHLICVVTSGDLARIYQVALSEERMYFFFNKYFMDGDHVVMDCMEQRLVKQNQREFLEDCRTGN